VRGQREVAEVVDAELELEMLLRVIERRHHHAGVVDEDVDPVDLDRDFLREHRHRCERREIERDEVHVAVGHRLADPVGSFRALRAAAAAQDHAGALRRERARGLEADPAVRARHHGDAVGEIRNVVLAPAHRVLPARSSSGTENRARYSE
jgi:hypothetical protein